jgi:hypothetical protein
MPRGRRGSAVDQSLFEAALIGFEQMQRNVEEKMAEIRQRLGTGSRVTGAAPGQHARRPLSAVARRRIAAAQRKRWATLKKAQGKAVAPAKVSTPKNRTMSAAARKRIGEATRKRWAEFRKKKAGKEKRPRGAVGWVELAPFLGR